MEKRTIYMNGTGCMARFWHLKIIHKKCLVKEKKLFTAFMDLKKAYNRADRKVYEDKKSSHTINSSYIEMTLSSARLFHSPSNHCNSNHSTTWQRCYGMTERCYGIFWKNMAWEGIYLKGSSLSTKIKVLLCMLMGNGWRFWCWCEISMCDSSVLQHIRQLNHKPNWKKQNADYCSYRGHE